MSEEIISAIDLRTENETNTRFHIQGEAAGVDSGCSHQSRVDSELSTKNVCAFSESCPASFSQAHSRDFAAGDWIGLKGKIIVMKRCKMIKRK